MQLGLSANFVWMNLLKTVLEQGRDVAPRGLATKEILNFTTKIDMTRPMVTWPERVSSDANSKFHAFMFAEAAWILGGENRVETIAPFSKMISRFSDDGIFYHGAYGPKIIDQISHVVKSLSEDPFSRQAVINIWRESPPPTKDVPCTISVQFMLRDGILYCFDTMRSSDAWLGWPFDVFNFTMLSLMVAVLLKPRLGYTPTLGTLHLTAASQHLYEKNFEAARSVLSSSFVDTPTTVKITPDVFNSQMTSRELIDALWVTAHVLKDSTRSLEEACTWMGSVTCQK